MRLQRNHGLKERRSAWKTEWTRLLHGESAVSAMANPEILVYLMDETIDQFLELLRVRPSRRWLNENPSQFENPGIACRCGLNPLLAYFATGQQALALVFSDQMTSASKNSNHYTVIWHFLAQREIQSLCGSCRRTCGVATGSFTVTVKPIRCGGFVPDRPSALRP